MLIHQLLASLQSKLREETRLQKEMFRLLGSLDLIMAAATVSNEAEQVRASSALDVESHAPVAVDEEHVGKRKAVSGDSVISALTSVGALAMDSKKLKRQIMA